MTRVKLGPATVVFASFGVGKDPTLRPLETWFKEVSPSEDFLQVTHHELAALHGLLIGRRSSRSGFDRVVSTPGPLRTVVLRLRPELVRDFSAIPQRHITALADKWARHPHLKTRNKEAAAIIAALRAAARRAQLQTQDLYMVMSIFPRRRPYGLWALSPTGRRTRVRATELVLRRSGGLHLDVNLAPHPASRDLHFISLSERTALSIRPTSGNWLEIDAAAIDVALGRRAPTPAERSAWRVYTRDAFHRCVPIQASHFVVQLRRGVELEIKLNRAAWIPGRVEVGARARRQLKVCFGACNSVQVGA